MGDGADDALERGFDDLEEYEKYKDSDLVTQYEHGLIDELGATIGQPWSYPGADLAAIRRARERAKTSCPICSKPLVKKEGKFGPFMGCSDYPECNGSRSV